MRSPSPFMLAAFMAPIALVACSSSDDTTPPSKDAGVSDGASAAFRATLANPAPDDLREGERIYFEETYGTEVLDGWPPADFMVDLWKSDEATWGEQFSKFGWIVDPGDDLPVGLKRGTKDKTKVHETCATCHVTKLDDGRLWSGMPASHLDWSGFRIAVNDAWVAAGFPSQVTPAELVKLQGIQQPGSSNADSVDDPRLVPADFPLYVNLGPRKHLGYTGAGLDARSQIFISVFTFGAGDDLPFPKPEIADPLVAYLSWTKSPKALDVDEEAAARGAMVFSEARCDTCHHVDDLPSNSVAAWVDVGPEAFPGDDPAHKHGTIATDGNFYSLGDLDPATDGGAGDAGSGPGPGIDKIIKFVYDNKLKLIPTDGYAVSDLGGLFASAPYLHNGSVPTLDALLMPAAQRPVTFMRDGHTIDTTKEGMHNGGHEFGTALSAEDKKALVAYLKSL